MSASPEVMIRRLHDRVREVAWHEVDRERLEEVALLQAEIIIELMFAANEVDPVLRHKKVQRISNQLFANLERLIGNE